MVNGLAHAWHPGKSGAADLIASRIPPGQLDEQSEDAVVEGTRRPGTLVTGTPCYIWDLPVLVWGLSEPFWCLAELIWCLPELMWLST